MQIDTYIFTIFFTCLLGGGMLNYQEPEEKPAPVIIAPPIEHEEEPIEIFDPWEEVET